MKLIVVQTPFQSPENKNWKVSNQCIASLVPFPGLYRSANSYGPPMGPNSLCHPIMFGVVLDFKKWAKFPILAVFSFSIKRPPSMHFGKVVINVAMLHFRFGKVF